MSGKNIKVKIVSEDSILIQTGDDIDLYLPLYMAQIAEQLQKKLKQYLLELIPSYTSMLLVADTRRIHIRAFLDIVIQQLNIWKLAQKNGNESTLKSQSRLINIPVFYGEEVAPDLPLMAGNTGMDSEEIIALHHQKSYVVFTLGFSPGFAYMGKVDLRIAEPRLPSPRERVAKGSVGIAGVQTGVYPQDSPGGWNIIGRSPMGMYEVDDANNLSCALQAGDRVKFFPIEKQEFLERGGTLVE